ncbi:hypothetical protein Tco_1501131 [Tanacetum coccineum]
MNGSRCLDWLDSDANGVYAVISWQLQLLLNSSSILRIKTLGSPSSRVILFGDIPTVIPSTSVVAQETFTIAPVISSAAPAVETTLIASPIGLCGLVPYSGSDSDSPDEMSLPEHISPLPAISPFLCTDSFEAPDSSDGPPSQDPYVAIVARWRSRKAFGTSGRFDSSSLQALELCFYPLNAFLRRLKKDCVLRWASKNRIFQARQLEQMILLKFNTLLRSIPFAIKSCFVGLQYDLILIVLPYFPLAYDSSCTFGLST